MALHPQTQKQWSLTDLQSTSSTRCGQAQPQMKPLYLYLIPGPALHRVPRGSLQSNSQEAKLKQGGIRSWERPASLILISWELRALKAQVSHTMPAVKMNSPFNSNLNHKTRSYPKAEITQLLHSKRISLKTGPHRKHHGQGVFIYAKKIIRRKWHYMDKSTNRSCFPKIIL